MFPALAPANPNTTYNQQNTETDFREEDAFSGEDAVYGYNGLIECLWA